MKVAIISPWKIRCGISTYCEFLVEKLREFCEVKVFAEYADGLESDSDCVRCWDRHDAGKKELIEAIHEFKPDIIHFQFEFGLYEKAFFFTLLLTKLIDYKIICTQHSVYDGHKDKTCVNSIMPNIICHTEEAKNCLISSGVYTENIHVIPHGIKADSNNLLDGLWKTFGVPVVLQPGFLFKYKGHLKSLDVIKILKEEYPDIHYIILGSENSFNQREHDEVYKEIINKINELELSDNVSIYRGFLSNEAIMSYIRTSSVVILPYMADPKHNVFGASGVAHLALSTTTGLVVSKSANIFCDIRNLVPNSDCVEELARYISDYIKAGGISQIEKDSRKEFLEKNSWASVAKQTFELYSEILNRI